MQCTSPVTLLDRGFHQEVPCGVCVSCRMARAREWSTRCLHEAAYWPFSAFVTLTYRDEDLPKGGGLDVRELQRFHKRLRKNLGRPIRYYACGEYGERTGRPHYHGVYFGLKPCVCQARPDEVCQCSDRKVVMESWGHGGVDRLGTVTYDSCRYVADYIGKKVVGRRALETYGLQEAPFSVMSRGIGARYVDDHAEQLRSSRTVTVHGVPVGLPRYYMHRLGLEAEFSRDSVVPSKRRWRWANRIPLEVVEVEPLREQRDKDALGRQGLSVKDFGG